MCLARVGGQANLGRGSAPKKTIGAHALLKCVQTKMMIPHSAGRVQLRAIDVAQMEKQKTGGAQNRFVKRRLVLSCVLLLGFLMGASSLQSQDEPGTVTGVVSDPTSALIPGAQISAIDSSGTAAKGVSDASGIYTLQLAPGEYRLQVSAIGFKAFESSTLRVASGRIHTHNVSLEIYVAEEQVRVSETSLPDAEPSSNASAITLSDSSLESLPDDSEDLAADLTALAGPSAGPEGGEIFVDGFSGATLPPKSAIREIRVNQNPFSAEYDRMGFGRVEILTKPGAAQLHGETRFNFGDSSFYSRNPFATEKPEFQRRIFEGTVTGPLTKKSSFTLQLEQRNIGQTAVINALVLDSSLNPISYRNSVINPTMNTEVSARFDYQLGENQALVGRYEWEKNTETNAGLDSFSLPSTAYNLDEREHLLQVTETAILSPRAVHELRFQYRRSHDVLRGLDSTPTIEVPGAFVSGGSTVGLSGLTENRYEFHDVLSLVRGQHSLRIGGRLRLISESNRSMENYNGLFTFSTLDAYRITESGLRDGLSANQIRAMGGGASQFTLLAGNPVAEVTQIDGGLFVQDDWRVRNDLTLSAGLRFEKQNNINDWSSWAPRAGLAWAPRRAGGQQPLVVIRAGFGLFYDRIRENLVLDSKRLDGVSQQEFAIPNPDFYPVVPGVEELANFAQQQVVRRLGNHLRAPYTSQIAFTVERQLFQNVTLSGTYMNSLGAGALRSENINTFLPGTYDPLVPNSGVRPLDGGNIYAYQSNGRFRQSQFIANVNARINKRYSLQGYYTWGSARSDTDGAQTFPGNPYDPGLDFGRAGFDVGHRVFVAGALTAPLGLVLSPFIVAHSGAPFNITTGEDLNGDSLFNDRPAWATDFSRPTVVATRWGSFDTEPQAGQLLIPRNLGTSPSMFAINLRISKTLGFGAHGGTTERISQGMQSGPGPGHGPHHDENAGSSDRKYNLTFSVAARNLFNRVNLDTPVGNLGSPLFGHSTSIHGYGHGSASANRTIDLQLRFSF